MKHFFALILFFIGVFIWMNIDVEMGKKMASEYELGQVRLGEFQLYTNGEELYRKLFAQIAEKKLFPKYLIGEIDYTHADLVMQEIRRYFPQASLEIKQDLAKKQRYFVIKF